MRGISTLGGATGQAAVTPPPPRKSKAPLLIGVGVVVLGALLAVVLLRGPSQPQPPVVVVPKQPVTTTTTATPPPPEPKKRPKWSVDSEPQGADIIRTDDGQVLGQTPWSGEQPDGTAPVEVKLHLTGFADRKLTLKPGADAAYMQTLKPKRGKKGDKGKSDGKNQDHKKDDGPEIAD